MTRMKYGVWILWAFFFLSSSILWADIHAYVKSSENDSEISVSDLTLPQKIGQMLMFGVSGKRLTPETQALIEKTHLGSIIFYGQNVRSPLQVRAFSSELQRTARLNHGIPLFIAVDQEGGPVTRVRKDAFALPSAMALGATRSYKLAFLAGKMTALELKSMGINMNLAPVLDVNTHQENSVIGTRSFGDDPELVSQMGVWYVEGLESQQVVATAKHFPGHGGTTLDSHYAIPTLSKNFEDLERFHVYPFRKAIENGLDAIMTAHLAVPSLDPSGLPATFSYNLMTSFLRDRLGFQGVVMTDDLEMHAISEQYDVSQAALKAILAGADLIMIGWTDAKKYQVFESLLKAVETGKLSMSRIDESVERILRLKQKRGLFELKPEDLDSPEVQYQAVRRQISAQAITVVENKRNILPILEDQKKRVWVASPLRYFRERMAFYQNDVQSLSMTSRPTKREIKEWVQEIKKNKMEIDVLVFGFTHASQLAIVNQLPSDLRKKVVVVSFDSPYFLKNLKEVSAYICSYGIQKDLMDATAGILSGVFRSQGRLPISIDPQHSFGKSSKVAIR